MLDVKLVELNNYGGREARLDEVIAMMKNVLNDPLFKTMILEFKTEEIKTFYYRKNIFGRYMEQPYSNEQVFDIIMNGVELPGDVHHSAMDLYLTLINGSDGNIIGYGNPGTKEIFTYSTMFDAMTVPELVNHFVHEWCHKIGFEHSFARNRMRSYSVPYAVGDIAEELAEKMMPQQQVNSFIVRVSVNFNNKGGQVTVIHAGSSGVILDSAVLTPQNPSCNFSDAERGDRIVVHANLIATAELTIAHATQPPTPYTLTKTQPKTFYL